MNPIHVAPAGPGDGPAVRRLRLAALRDTPGAFSSSLVREERLPEAHWSDLAAGEGRFAGNCVFVATLAGEPAGIAGAYPEAPGRYRLFGVWVREDARERGVARRLVDAIEAWVAERGTSELAVAVYEDNAAAIALYRGCGFEPRGGPGVPAGDDAATPGRPRELQLAKTPVGRRRDGGQRPPAD